MNAVAADPYEIAELRELLVAKDTEIAILRRKLEEAEKRAEGYRNTVKKLRKGWI